MKISPVAGIPTIPNPSATGLSSDKLAAIKALAAGQPAPAPEEKEKIQLGDLATSATQRIQMTTNRTVNRNGDGIIEMPADSLDRPPADYKDQSKPIVANPDTNEQAQLNPEAIRPISPQLAQLAKERQALRIEREKFAEERKAAQTGNQTAEALIKELQSAPLSVLQKHGVTYDQLTNEILGNQSSEAKVQAQIDALTKSVDERLAAKDSQQEESVYNYMRQNVDKLAFSSDEYKLIRETKSQDDVMDFIKTSWKEAGDILDEEEAMGIIEGLLREDARRYAKLMGELEPTTTPAETPPVQATARPVTKTLTNKDSARPTMGRRQRAIAAMLGQKTN